MELYVKAILIMVPSLSDSEGSWKGDVRVRAIRQSHERQQWPFVLRSRIRAILNTDPRLDFGAPFNSIRTAKFQNMEVSSQVPSVMEADDADNRLELRLCRHCGRNGFPDKN